MPSDARFPLLHPAISLSFSRATSRALGALAGGALDDVEPSDRLAMAEALFTRRFSAPFCDLLDDISRLGDETAREALVEAAIDRGLEHRSLLDAPPVDLGARVARKARRDGRWKAVATRARIRLGRRFARLAWYEARLSVASRPGGSDVFERAGRSVHGDDHVRTFVADTEDGVLHAAIVHRGPAVRVVTCDADVTRARVLRPLACDLLRWDAIAGRVAFSLARPLLLVDWKQALAAASGAPLGADRLPFTLKLVHERGSALFTKGSLPSPVRDVEVVACELDDGTRFGARGPGALEAMHARLGFGGYIYRATFRFGIDGAPRPVDATIELPDKLLVAEPRWEAEIRDTLQALGLMDPGALADDLASLAPFVHPEWRWVSLLGRERLDAAIARGILVRARSRRAGEPRHRVWGSMFTAHDLEGEEDKYAVADDAAARAHTVKASALAHLRLDLGALAGALRAALALEPCAITDAPRGALPIGTLVTKSARLVFFLLLAAVPESACAALREAVRKACTKGQTPVVLVGPGRTLHGGIAEVEVSVDEQLGGESIARVVAEAAKRAGVEDEIEAWRWGTPAAPLVIVREVQEVWLGRVRLEITAGQYAAFEALASERAGWMTPTVLGRAVSPSARWHDQIARKTLLDLDTRVARSFAEAKIALPEEWRGRVIEMKKGKGYRLGVGVVVR